MSAFLKTYDPVTLLAFSLMGFVWLAFDLTSPTPLSDSTNLAVSIAYILGLWAWAVVAYRHQRAEER